MTDATAADTVPAVHGWPEVARWSAPDRRASVILVALLLAVTGVIMVSAMLRTSTTFDEIVMVAGGARGYETGDWSLVPEHPPLVQYLYGLPVHLAGVEYPDESEISNELRGNMAYRYIYARGLYWQVGNDPERIAFLSRLPAVLCALGLILLMFLWARAIAGAAAGWGAAVLTASLPDLLAHGGIAYNDVPLALAFVGSLWALDSAIRRPSIRRGVVAGLCVALALGVKNSAIALGPIVLILLVWEAARRRHDLQWRRLVLPAAGATLLSVYAGLVAIYRGDVLLTEYRYALWFVVNQVTRTTAPSYLLGEISTSGFWYYFPVAFLFKTSAGLHLLGIVALAGLALQVRRSPRRLADTRLRAPLIGLLIFGGLLLPSSLNIGFRHALPLLPLIVLLTCAGVVHAWPLLSRTLRVAVVAAFIWPVVHVASFYPFFISYMSEYGPGQDRAHAVLADSSLDWGQGLLELRRFMREHDIPSVYLSYFGSALPGGYGITHVPMSSYFALPAAGRPDDGPPRWAAISATNLTGTYFRRDPFRAFRESTPAHIVGRSIFIYPMTGEAP
jgi:hypothetical protein